MTPGTSLCNGEALAVREFVAGYSHSTHCSDPLTLPSHTTAPTPWAQAMKLIFQAHDLCFVARVLHEMLFMHMEQLMTLTTGMRAQTEADA